MSVHRLCIQIFLIVNLRSKSNQWMTINTQGCNEDSIIKIHGKTHFEMSAKMDKKKQVGTVTLQKLKYILHVKRCLLLKMIGSCLCKDRVSTPSILTLSPYMAILWAGPLSWSLIGYEGRRPLKVCCCHQRFNCRSDKLFLFSIAA